MKNVKYITFNSINRGVGSNAVSAPKFFKVNLSQMQAKGHMPYFEDPTILAEIDIRGRFMMMACDIEWSMLNIILYSTNDFNNHHRANQFKGMMMHEKIECTICDLKKYHPHYYAEYKDYLDMLMEFKEVRNDMGHYRLDFEDPTLKSFKMPFIGEENGELKVLWKKYTVEQMKDIITRFRKANMMLMELVAKLYNEYNVGNTNPQIML